MVKLLEREILSKDVLNWKGLHLFHAALSSCSQKTRIFLAEKGVPWQSHPIDLLANENISDYYLGINPRGLVPALVDDGSVHIESNDIILYLEEKFPEPRLMPAHPRSDLGKLLYMENDLHGHIRNITFRFIVEPPVAPKSKDVLHRYGQSGSSTVGGEVDQQKSKEIAYWTRYGEHRVSDEDARRSVNAFRDAFDALDKRLDDSAFLLGPELSIADIAWFIYASRLQLAGYPLDSLHPHIGRWYDSLICRPGWAEEIALPPSFQEIVRHHQTRLGGERRRLVDICGLTDAVCVS